MKKLFILFCCLFFIVPSYVLAYQNDNVDLKVISDESKKVDTSLKIYDYANLIDDDKEAILYSKVSKYIDKTNFDMVIVTISDNNKGSTASYADDFYDYNGFGFDDDYSGILYLIDMDNSEAFISTTGVAIDVYNDYSIESMLDDIYIDLKNEDYYESCVTFINVSTDYFSSPDVVNVVTKKINWPLSIVIALIVPSVVIVCMISSHKKIKLAISANDYVDRKATKIGVAKDKFLTKNVSRIYIQPPTSSSGGGSSTRIGSSGGGSSTRIGSSGRSHGGGGRKF